MILQENHEFDTSEEKQEVLGDLFTNWALYSEKAKQWMKFL